MGTELQSPPETLYATNVRRIAELEDALASITRERDAMREAHRKAGHALDVADRLIERGYGLDTPDEWNAAYRAVADAAALVNGEGGE